MLGEKELGEFVCVVNNMITELNNMNDKQKEDLNSEFCSGFNSFMCGLYRSLSIVDRLRYNVDMIHEVGEKHCLILSHDKVYKMHWSIGTPTIERICTLPFFSCDVKKVFQTIVDSCK